MEEEKTINVEVLLSLVRSPEWSERVCRYLEPVLDYARCVAGWRFDKEAVFASVKDDPEGYRSEQERLDKARTAKHDRAISSLSVLNKLAESAGKSPVFLGDLENRKAVANAIFDLCIDNLESEKRPII